MELKIDKHIHELLYRYNCVIIPGFGGFVGNYQGAEIHPAQHIFTSPRKQIAFNKNLTLNDGLLAQHIVQTEKLSYLEAIELIDKDVFKMRHLLSSGERVSLKDIGSLKLDVEKNIQFNPIQSVNYELHAFGLYSFQSSAIKRGHYEGASGQTFIDRPALKVKKGFKKYRRFALPAIVLPVAVALFLSPFSKSFKQTTFQTSGFFGHQEIALYKPEAHTFNLKAATLPALKVMEQAPPVQGISEEATIVDTPKATVIDQPSTTIEKGTYTLIAGCFSLIENAQKQVELLSQKNISAAIIGKTNNGLYRVGIGEYHNASEASAAMLEMKASQIEVWVLKN
jgi:nucleoid DNA-binding protein